MDLPREQKPGSKTGQLLLAFAVAIAADNDSRAIDIEQSPRRVETEEDKGGAWRAIPFAWGKITQTMLCLGLDSQ